MKPHLFHIILLASLSGLLIGCGNNSAKNKPKTQHQDSNTTEKNQPVTTENQKKNQLKTDSTNTSVTFKNFDSDFYKIDTIVVMEAYKILFTKGSSSSGPVDDGVPITVHLVDQSNDSVIYKKEFEENYFDGSVSFRNGEETLHYFSLVFSGGGSGYLTKWYKVTPDKEPYFLAFSIQGELSWSSFSKDGDEMLVLDGIWNFDQDESHFGEHVYEIKKYDLRSPHLKEYIAGTTLNKYPSMFEGVQSGKELVDLIKKSEPGLFEQIDLSKYKL